MARLNTNVITPNTYRDLIRGRFAKSDPLIVTKLLLVRSLKRTIIKLELRNKACHKDCLNLFILSTTEEFWLL